MLATSELKQDAKRPAIDLQATRRRSGSRNIASNEATITESMMSALSVWMGQARYRVREKAKASSESDAMRADIHLGVNKPDIGYYSRKTDHSTKSAGSWFTRATGLGGG